MFTGVFNSCYCIIIISEDQFLFAERLYSTSHVPAWITACAVDASSPYTAHSLRIAGIDRDTALIIIGIIQYPQVIQSIERICHIVLSPHGLVLGPVETSPSYFT